VQRKGKRIGGGLGSARGLLAFLSLHDLLWACNPHLLLIHLVLSCEYSGFEELSHGHSASSSKNSDQGSKRSRSGGGAGPIGLYRFALPLITGFVAIMNSRIVGYVDLVRHPRRMPTTSVTGYSAPIFGFHAGDWDLAKRSAVRPSPAPEQKGLKS